MHFLRSFAYTLLFTLIFLMNTACNESKVLEEEVIERFTISVVDSIGIEMGDSCYVLGAISDAEVSPSGNLLLLDKSFTCIREYSSGGVFLSFFSRNGSAPGELQYPHEMTIMPDGRIMVWDMFKQAIVVLSDLGESLEDLSGWSLFLPTSISALDEDLFTGCEMKFDMNDSHMLVVIKPSLYSYSSVVPEYSYFADTLRFNLDGSDMVMSIDGLTGRTLMATDADGRVFYSRKSSSEGFVHCWDIEGTHLFSVSLDFPPVGKTEQEIAAETEFTRIQFAALGQNGLPDGFEPDPYHTYIENIGIDADGFLWVQRGTEPNPVFDVFDREGNQIAVVEFPRVGKEWQFSITPYGALAWDNDPQSGIQRVYTIDLPELNL